MLKPAKFEVGVQDKPTAGGHDLARAGKFGAVGLTNTLLDFSIFNVLSSLAHLTLVQSNIISTTITMIISFFANKRLVFEKNRGSVAKEAFLFLAVTAFGLYVLQTGTIKILTDVWLTPVAIGLVVAHYLGIVGHDQFLTKNGAKAIATVVSLAWNYVMYKKVVFP